MMTFLFILLVLALIGAAPTWSYSRGWGYAPTGLLGTLLVVLLVLVLVGTIRI